MLQSNWLQVREELGQKPILESTIGGATPLFVERYMYQTMERTVSGLGCTGLVSLFGGASVLEGEQDRWRSQTIATNSMLVPRGTATHWHYSGTVDFAVFYFLEDGSDTMMNLESLADARGQPLSLNDLLVGAAAQQLVSELHKGMMADQAFMSQLAAVMLEQAYRVLTTPACGGINPRHAHFPRLQAVLNHIHRNPADDLSADALARLAGVSQAHFRRLFLEAVGMPPHRYVLAARLEQVRKLLSLSEMPLVRIAQECGFSSQSHLTASFRAAHAVTPAQFRARLSRKG